jgi:hypothetical protein
MDIERLAVVAFCSCALAANTNAAVNLAIVKLNDEGHNYLYTPSKINAGDIVYFQFPKSDNPTCCKHEDGQMATLATPDSDAVDFDSNRTLYRYKLVSTGVSSELPFLGIAVIGKDLTVTPTGTWRLKAQSASDTHDLILCTSTEGVHLTSQSGGKALSHLYLYLGYDIDNPTCDTR